MNINLKSLQPLGTLDVAARVLQAIDDRIDAETAEACCIHTFCNGREQGFCINLALPRGYSYKVLFSGDRVTDSIVVYFGHSQQFDFRINLPKDDDVWSTAIGFAHDEIGMAAERIVQILREAKGGVCSFCGRPSPDNICPQCWKREHLGVTAGEEGEG